MSHPTTIIGITGGIGSGKSSVSQLLSAYCKRPAINVDDCCRDLLEQGQSGWHALHEAFGDTFLQPGGDIDRSKLREQLFEDETLRTRVDSLIHPLARQRLRQVIEQSSEKLVFIEVPLLYEVGWESDCTAVIVVYVDRNIQVDRTCSRDGVSREQGYNAVAAQMALKEKAARADYIIDNSGMWRDTRERVIELGLFLEEKFG